MNTEFLRCPIGANPGDKKYFIVPLVIWLVYFLTQTFLKQVVDNKLYLDALQLVEVPFLFIAFFTTIKLSFVIKDRNTKKVMLYFALSFLSIALAASIYDTTYRVLHLDRELVVPIIRIADNILYTSYLLFPAIALYKILGIHNWVSNQKQIFPVLIILVFVVCAFFVLPAPMASDNIIVQTCTVLQQILRPIDVFLAVIFISISTNKGMTAVIIGYLISIVVDMFADFGFENIKFGVGNVILTFWVMAALLYVFGIAYLKKTSDEHLTLKNLIYSCNSVKVANMIWMLAACFVGVGGYAIALILCGRYSFAEFNLLQIGLGCSVILVAIICNMFSRMIIEPLSKLEQLSQLPCQESLAEQSCNNFYLAEFQTLYTTVSNSFQQLKQNAQTEEEQKQLADKFLDLAAKKAHDANNYLAYIAIFIKTLDIPDDNKKQMQKTLSDTTRLLCDITRKKMKTLAIAQKPLIATVKEIFENAKIQYENIKITFACKIQEEVQVNTIENNLEEALINVIKNAAEALQKTDDPQITITLYQQDGKVLLDIADNGEPIPKENIAIILNGGFTTKQDGHGIGLSSSKKFLESVGGQLDIQSSNNWTVVTMVLV